MLEHFGVRLLEDFDDVEGVNVCEGNVFANKEARAVVVLDQERLQVPCN